MIKLKSNNVFILGLSYNNIEELKKDRPIAFNMQEIGGADEKIVIMTGQDEKAIIKKLNTELHLNLPEVNPEPKTPSAATLPVGSNATSSFVREKKVAVIKIPEDIQNTDVQYNGVHPLVIHNAFSMLLKHTAQEVVKLAQAAVGNDDKAQERWIDEQTKKLLR